jgi:hypothetical protein
MKKLSNNQWEKIEYNPLNSMAKIGFYDETKNAFNEVARWRNTHGATGANYGCLQIWSITFDFIGYEKQKGCNYAGGYNKPIANLESCLYQLKKAIENKEVVTDSGDFNYSNFGSIDSLLNELKDYLQKQYTKKLFIVSVC